MKRIRLAASLAVLVAMALGLASLGSQADQNAGGPAAFSLPPRVGEWIATRDEKLDEEVLAIVEADTYAMRLYQADDRTPVWVYVGMYGGRGGYGKGAHDPEICFPAQGWEIVRSSSASVAPDGQGIHSKLLRVQRANLEQSVLYWFQPAGRWPRAGILEQLLRALDAASGRPQYAFVRLSGPRDPGDRSDADLMDLAAALAPAIRTRVEAL